MDRTEWMLLVTRLLLIGTLLFLAIEVSHLQKAVSEIESDRDFYKKVAAMHLPLDFLTGEPDCANRLLERLGIDNVRLMRHQTNRSEE